MAKSNQIPIITYSTVNVDTRNPDTQPMEGRSPDTISMGKHLVSSEQLAARFNELLALLGRTLELPQKVGSLAVDGLDIELELTAEGEFGLLGNGGRFGGKGSLTLRLKRP